MNVFKSSVVITSCLMLLACANSPVVDKKAVFAQAPLTDQQINTLIVGHKFAAQVKTGRHTGWYEVNIRSNGKLIIDDGRFTRRWTASGNQLCITPCFKFYKNPEAENQYFAVENDEIDVLLKLR